MYWQVNFKSEEMLETAIVEIRRSHRAKVMSRISEHEAVIRFNMTTLITGSQAIDRGVVIESLWVKKGKICISFLAPSFKLGQLVSEMESIGSILVSNSLLAPINDSTVDTMADDEILKTAWQMGYFDNPKNTSLQDIAEKFEVSTTMARRRIFRALRRRFEGEFEFDLGLE